MKIELIEVTGVSLADTITSNLASPQAASIFLIEPDSFTGLPGVSISGRILTVTGLTPGAGDSISIDRCVFEVYGY